MKLKGLLFLAGGLLLGFAMGALVLFSSTSGSATQNKPPTTGEAAKDFQLTRLDGESQSLEQTRGKAVILNFWATWCGPCQEEMPLLDQYAQQYADQLVILGIDDQEDEKTVTRFIQERQIRFPILLDPNGTVSDLYFVRNYPTSYFIDADGIIRAQHLGVLREDLMDDYLKTIGIKP